MKVTIVGVRSSKSSKTGKDIYFYYGTKSFTDYERQSGYCEGEAIISEYSGIDYGLKVGDVCEFNYEPGYQGKATLSGVTVLEPSGK